MPEVGKIAAIAGQTAFATERATSTPQEKVAKAVDEAEAIA